VSQHREADAETNALFAEFAVLPVDSPRRQEVRDELVTRHLPLVNHLARRFNNRGEPLEDLVQVATVGLINSVDRFDPDRGVEFLSYAVPTIVGEIKRYFRDKAWNLKVPRSLQELNLQVIKANDTLSQHLGRSPTITEIAAHVGASEEETLDAMELGNAYEMISLDSKLTFEGETAPLTVNDSVGVADLGLEKVETYDDLKDAVECLDNREKMIIYLRFFQGLSQTEVARRLKISQMHVSRLQHRALNRLKELLTASDEEEGSAD
jgi:RNA polymerase sigma-B factor